MSRKSFLSSNSLYSFLIASLVILLYGIYQYPAGLESGDPGIKHFQVLDFIQQGFQSNNCYYMDQKLDPEMKFFPFNIDSDNYMAHFTENGCFYVFPFYFAWLITPFYLLAGPAGGYGLVILFSIGILYIVRFWARKEGLSEKVISLMLLYLGMGTYVLFFSGTLSEMAISAFLTTLGFFLIGQGIGKKSTILFGIAGAIFASSSFLRQESAVIGVLAGAIYFFLYVVKYRNKSTLLNFLAYTGAYLIIMGVQILINLQVVGFPFGLRQKQQMNELESDFLIQRLLMFIEIFIFGRNSVGLLTGYPILTLLLIRFKSLLHLPQTMKIGAYSAILYSLLIPLLTVTYQGVGWGPRFLFTVFPVFILITFYIINQNDFFSGRISRILLWSAMLVSFLGIGLMASGVHQSKRIILNANRDVEEKAGEALIFRNPVLISSGGSTHLTRHQFYLGTLDDFSELVGVLSKAGIQKASLISLKEETIDYQNRISEKAKKEIDSIKEDDFVSRLYKHSIENSMIKTREEKDQSARFNSLPSIRMGETYETKSMVIKNFYLEN